MKISLTPDFGMIAAPFSQVLANAVALAGQKASGEDNIIQYSAPCRISPPTIVDGSLANFEDLTAILKTTNSIVAAYYFQAIGRGINTESATLIRTIDQLQPNRNVMAAMGRFVEQSANEHFGDSKSLEMRTKDYVRDSVQGIAAESLHLPDPTRPETLLPYKELVTEASDGKVAKKIAEEEIKQLAAMQGKISSKNVDADLMEAPNLAVGKIFDVVAKFGQNEVSVPVSVVLNPILSTPNNLVDIYAVGAGKQTFKERLRLVQSGELRFWADFVGQQDLIDDHKRTAMRDNTGTYMANREREANNRIAALLTGKISIGTASAIAVVNARTVRKIEAAIGGKLSVSEVREKMFKRTSLAIFIEVDVDWKQVTIYHRGVPQGRELPVSDFVKAKSKPGSDVSDLVQMFLAGKTLSL